jgi:hypothetical protein
LDVTDIIVANACCLVILSIKHVTSFGQVNHSERIWLIHEVVILKLLGGDEVLKNIVEISQLLR